MSLRCCLPEPRGCGLFPHFVVLDFQRGGLLIGCGIRFLKLVFCTLKNVLVTEGAKELKCSSHTGEKMTKVPQGFDFSFLNDEEARKILQVLERNEELQRADKDRIRYTANSSHSFPGALRGRGRARRGRAAGAAHLSGPPGERAAPRGKAALGFSREGRGRPGRAGLRVSGAGTAFGAFLFPSGSRRAAPGRHTWAAGGRGGPGGVGSDVPGAVAGGGGRLGGRKGAGALRGARSWRARTHVLTDTGPAGGAPSPVSFSLCPRDASLRPSPTVGGAWERWHLPGGEVVPPQGPELQQLAKLCGVSWRRIGTRGVATTRGSPCR